MRFSLLHLSFVGLFAPITMAAYNCLDLPNVYTIEDLNAIKVDCKDATILASKIYPSATWIIHGYADASYYDWLIPESETTPPWRQLHRICVVTFGGGSPFGAIQRELFTFVSGNCGGSYPVDYASSYNFIDIGTENFHFYHDKKELKYPSHLVENGEDVPSDEPNVLHIRSGMQLYGLEVEKEFESYGGKMPRIVEHIRFPPTPIVDVKPLLCTAWGVNAENLNKCTSIVGPIVYKGEFYGIDKLNFEDRPYHHGCFTAEKVPFTDLSFLEKVRTKSDYVDRCIGKFANVVRNSPGLCPDPKTYYAYMDPDPESEIRTAFLNSEFNKKGEFYVKMEFPEGINYDCVNKCTGDITDDNVKDLREGKYGYACKTITGSVTLIKPQWKDPQTNTVLGEIREIIGKLTIFAEVDRNVLPNLRTIHSEADDFALELTITDENEFEPILPMRLTKVTANGEHSIELKHSMDKARIPQSAGDLSAQISFDDNDIQRHEYVRVWFPNMNL